MKSPLLAASGEQIEKTRYVRYRSISLLLKADQVSKLQRRKAKKNLDDAENCMNKKYDLLPDSKSQNEPTVSKK